MTGVRIYADTSALLALADARDQLHGRARAVHRSLADRRALLVTTVHVVDETLTLVRRRVHHRRAVEFGGSLLGSGSFEVVYPGGEATAQALRWFERYADVPLSFTDCLSFVVMRGLGLTEAFTFDDHFRLMGFEVCAG